MMDSVKYWVEAARPKTLFAAAAPVLIGTSVAYGSGVSHVPAAVLALTSAVLIQIGTNFFNDYADAGSGVDTSERKGPKRGVHSGHIEASAMKNAAILTFFLAVLAGAYLMWRGGWPIILIGISSIVFGFFYTASTYSLSRLGIADAFVFLFFGPVAVAGTYYVQSLTWPSLVWLIGVAPGVLSVAILLVNNIRDIEEDRAGGKHTMVVRFGRSFGVRAYIGCMLVAAVVPAAAVMLFEAPVTTMISSVVLLGALPQIHTLRTTSVEKLANLNPVLASTARLLFYFSGLYGLAWVLAA